MGFPIIGAKRGGVPKISIALAWSAGLKISLRGREPDLKHGAPFGPFGEFNGAGVCD